MKPILIVLSLLFSLPIADSEDNNVALGYQIGGNTLVGFDYELRVSDLVGIHAGAGYIGAGGGVRFHFDDEVHASYFDINYKDCGLGLMESIGFEIGGTWLVATDSGVRGSFGIQKILWTEDDFERQIFDGEKAPSVILAFQIGWAW